MKTLWQELLEGKGQSSNIIKEEILNLNDSGKELESGLVELETTLQGLQKNLLAEKTGSFEAVRATEANISEHRNKIAAISNIIKELEIKLTEVLIDEKKNRQKEIISEIALIDKKMKESRLEMVGHFAKASVLYKDITGQEYYNLSSEHFENYGLTGNLRDLIAEKSADDHRVSLYQRRQTLSAEGIRLNK